MGTLNSDRKLELLRQIRQENQVNQLQMKSREAFVYGTAGAYENPYHSCEWEAQLQEAGPGGQEKPAVSSFRIRLVLALFLFGVFFYMDKTDYHVGNIGSEYVIEQIQAGDSTNLFAFINRFPYTEKD